MAMAMNIYRMLIAGKPTVEPSNVYRNNKRNELFDHGGVVRSNQHCHSINIQILRI